MTEKIDKTNDADWMAKLGAILEKSLDIQQKINELIQIFPVNFVFCR